jgi:archaellum component FlaC
MAQAKTLAFSGFTAPRVPAGKYKIVLTKDKETFTHTIEVKYDEKSITTLEQRKEQEALTNKLFNMVEDLAYMIYEITETQAKATEVVENNPKGIKDAQKLFDALENLRKDLVITTGDNYVASAEPELREKMGDLYSNVASNFNKVSGASQANYELIADDFSEEKKRYEEIMAKEGKKFNSFLEKNNIAKPELLSKEEFLKKG